MTTPEAGVEALKERHRAMWGLGDYASIADRVIAEMGPRMAERVGASSGMRILDVACGAGNATLPLAGAGSTVVGLDLVPSLLDVARERAEAEGLEVELVEGDAEDLPFEDGGFDAVVSTVGTQFAPRHEVCARELVRVCAPGGRIVQFNWTPQGFIGGMLAVIGPHMPPPPEFASPPPLWGDEGHVRELFADSPVELSFERESIDFEFDSAEDFAGFFFERYGPTVAARSALESEGRFAGLRDDLIEYARSANVATGEGFRAPSEYLVITATKTA